MDNGPLDDRLKKLFAELEDHVESPEGQANLPAAAPRKNRESPNGRVDGDTAAPHENIESPDSRADEPAAALLEKGESPNGRADGHIAAPPEVEKVQQTAAADAKTRPADSICPFLRTQWDDTIRYGYPHEENVCIKNEKARPVSLANQEIVCLGKHHTQCPVFVTEKKNNHKIGSIFQFLKKPSH